ncbi:MAG: hypothetical protein LBV32_09845 [Tannerellaceae bacterium]|jgi:hypothetical protein|nr:hypothetical protein [Tannerellaceae bacterium]
MNDLHFLSEQTIVSIARSGLPLSARNSLYKRLYLFHREYDAGITGSFWFFPENKEAFPFGNIDPEEDYPLLETIREVVEILCKEENYELSALWFQAITKYIFWNAEEEDRPDIEALQPFLLREEVYERLQADTVFMEGLTAVQQEWEDLPAFSKEWLTQFQKWDVESYADADVIIDKLIRFFSERSYRETLELAHRAQVYYPGHALIILYECISNVMHQQTCGIHNAEAYKEWAEKLSVLQNLETGSPDNTYTIQTHARYYLAIARMMVGDYKQAEDILCELVETYRMPGAKELQDFFHSAATN